jgi:hypothetical protein
MVEVEGIFPLPVLTPATGWGTTFAEEDFSVTLSPEDCSLNFFAQLYGLSQHLLLFRGLIPRAGQPLARFRFSVVFFSARAGIAVAAACCFLDIRAVGSERG